MRSTGLRTGNLSSSNKQSRMRRVIRHSLGVVRVYQNVSAELRHELVTGFDFSRYEQFETSPETIEHELRPSV